MSKDLSPPLPSHCEPVVVPVAVYRDSVDHLFRIINTDYHACCSNQERKVWLERAKCSLSKVKSLHCKRAKERDHSQRSLSIEQAEKRIELCSRRLFSLTLVHA